MTDPTTITPDEAVQRLTHLAQLLTKMAQTSPPAARETYAKDAAAINWILTLTAYGVDHDEITV